MRGRNGSGKTTLIETLLGLIPSIVVNGVLPFVLYQILTGRGVPVLTALLVPIQILLVAFAMRGFQQGWNVELERRELGPHYAHTLHQWRERFLANWSRLEGAFDFLATQVLPQARGTGPNR